MELDLQSLEDRIVYASTCEGWSIEEGRAITARLRELEHIEQAVATLARIVTRPPQEDSNG